MTNINETMKQHGIETYGYDITEVTKYISDDMKDKFAAASEDMSKRENRLFMQACYNCVMQMKSVTSTGKVPISDSAIKDTYNLLLAAEE